MEVMRRRFPLPGWVAAGSGRVHRARRVASGAPLKNERGFTLIEVVMTMVLLSVGLLSLAPVMLAVFQGNRFAQDLAQGTALAEDRMEEIVQHTVYSEITTARFFDEAQGQIRQGDPQYAKFGRTVAIVDSLDVLANSVLKGVTVTVSWRGLDGVTRTVTLYSRVARF